MFFRTFVLLPILLHSKPGYFEPWNNFVVSSNKKPVEEQDDFTSSFISTINFYKRHISPLHTGMSHFKPSSSSYMLDAINKYGIGLGFLKGCDRLIRENGEIWYYQTCVIDQTSYKYDPP